MSISFLSIFVVIVRSIVEDVVWLFLLHCNLLGRLHPLRYLSRWMLDMEVEVTTPRMGVGGRGVIDAPLNTTHV